MKRRRIGIALLVLAAAVAGLASAQAAGVALTLVPPHRTMPSRATLSPGLVRRAEAAASGVHSTDDAIDAALAITSDRLRFGLGHPTRLFFDETEREGHCAEYAQLFAAVFQRIVARAGVRAHAVVLRSDARVFGQPINKPGWKDHDWVLVTEQGSTKSWYVDPSFADTGLGWDVKPNVRDLQALPKQRIQPAL